MNKAVKSVILYHRSYRKISGSPWTFLLAFVCIALPLSLAIILFHPEISRMLSLVAQAVLTPYFPQDTLRIIESPYITRNVFLLELPSAYPTLLFSIGNALASLALLALLPGITRAKHVFIFLIVVAFINFLSSLFFTFFPYRFPYEAVDYSELYIKQQLSIWFFVPVIMGLAVLPLPSTLASKVATILFTVCYSLVFGTARYAVFLFVLSKISLLYMAVLFFVLGPLIDFVYIVGVYSVHVAWLAKKMKGDFATWKWSY